MPKKSAARTYRKLSDIEHVLLRPGMYIGSIKHRDETVLLLADDGSFQPCPVTFNPAFLKIFDEIVSNSADEHRRNPKLNRIVVTIADGRITVHDNGGIPVVKHDEYDEWVPEMIFSNLKAGSNFDDDEERLVAGTNGVGSTLTNIYSLEFIVRTCDRKHTFEQTFRNNMRERDEPVVKRTRKKGYTEISFVPDLARFDMTEIDEDHINLMRKRCVDLAACNPGLEVEFNGETYKFRSFEAYCRLYGAEDVPYQQSERWRVAVGPSSGSFEQVSFVNSVETTDGGTHVDYVTYQVIDWLRAQIKRKHKVQLRPQEIKNHLRVFVQCDIVNPVFSSQTKEKMITEPRDFGSRFKVAEALLKAVLKSEVVQNILDWAQQKKQAEERKKLRSLNKQLKKGKVLKLIDAKARVGRDRCTLAIFEGDSASGAFRKHRDPSLQGAFPIRGKFINVSELPPTKVIQNKEVNALLMALGLQMGVPPANLRYGKILIYADADPDGDAITGLLVNFFGRYWPELLEQERVWRVQTPLVVAKKGNQTKWFYTQEEFEAWVTGLTQAAARKWDIAYKKGLAALEDDEYREIIQNPRMFAITPGPNLRSVLDCWFGKDPAARKAKLLPPEVDENDDDNAPE